MSTLQLQRLSLVPKLRVAVMHKQKQKIVPIVILVYYKITGDSSQPLRGFHAASRGIS